MTSPMNMYGPPDGNGPRTLNRLERWEYILHGDGYKDCHSDFMDVVVGLHSMCCGSTEMDIEYARTCKRAICARLEDWVLSGAFGDDLFDDAIKLAAKTAVVEFQHYEDNQ